jgi:hypothetical protein
MRLVKIGENLWINPERVTAVTNFNGVQVWFGGGEDNWWRSELSLEHTIMTVTGEVVLYDGAEPKEE